MTDDEVLALRVAELRRRQSAAPRSDVDGARKAGPTVGSATNRTNTRGVATGSRIAVTGIGFTAMLGLVAAMGIANRSSQADVPLEPSAPSPARVLVAQPAAVPVSSAGALPTPDTAVTVTNEPVVLTAQPIVQQAPVSQAPSGRTNGSR